MSDFSSYSSYGYRSKFGYGYGYGNSSSSRIKCHKCGGPHYANQCTTRCYICGGPHYKTNCPRAAGGGGGQRQKKKKKEGGWDGMLVKELKVKCRERGLPVSGRKDALIARLKDFVKAHGEGERPVTTAAERHAVAAAADAAAAASSDVYDLFEVKDDSKTVTLANAVANFGSSRPTCHPVSGSKPTAVAATTAVNMATVTPATASRSPSLSQTSLATQHPAGDLKLSAAAAAVVVAAATAKMETATPTQLSRLPQSRSTNLSLSQNGQPASKPSWPAQAAVKLETVTPTPSSTFSQSSGADLAMSQLSQIIRSSVGPSPVSVPESSGLNQASVKKEPSTSNTNMALSLMSQIYQPSAGLYPATLPKPSGPTQAAVKMEAATSIPIPNSNAKVPGSTQEQRDWIEQNREKARNTEAKAPPELTKEQKERMKRNLEGARKKKMARLSGQKIPSSAAGRSAPAAKRTKGARPSVAAAVNPYLRKPPAMKRDESKPDDSVLLGAAYEPPPPTLDDLPPLPPDAPPVREETTKRLSYQQLAVIMAGRPPPPPEKAGGDDNKGAVDKINTSCVNKRLFPSKEQHAVQYPAMIRVNAAAGTGKTTTLLHLANRCIDLGHKSVTYVTYARAAAKDAEDRMREALDEKHKMCVTASTLHSCAFRLLKLDELDPEEPERNEHFVNDTQFKNLIKENWSKEIEEHLKDAKENVRLTTRKEDRHKLARKERLLEDKVVQLLFKTFENFTRKKLSFESLENPQCDCRHHWPIRKREHDAEFKEGGKAAKLGFPPKIYSSKSRYAFYADTCVLIWKYVLENGVRTFNIDMKRAQLKKLRVPSSVLLVDECQDLDECQVDFIENQTRFGTHIFFVGDAAQCIYSFRGAKSSNVMKLFCLDLKLTKSFRFGANIAKIANIALFAKEKSGQTTTNHGDRRLWIPYRVEGSRREEEDEDISDRVRGGVVTTKSLVKDWQMYKQLTMIGRTNAGLMIKALDLIGLEGLKNPEDGECLGSSGDRSELQPAPEVGIMTSAICGSMQNIPKFHINGKGETSGSRKWRSSAKEIRHLYKLFTNRDETGEQPMPLPVSTFKEFANEGPVTWGLFIEICQVKEYKKYNSALNFIFTYKHNTLAAMDIFESHVMGVTHSAEEADIILTTCHSAKGLEWDNVEVCDDLLDLSAASYTENAPPSLKHPSFLKATPGQIKLEASSASLKESDGDCRKGWQFGLSSWSVDDINALYVAFTRAKKTLSVPSSIKKLLHEFDMLHYLVGSFKRDALSADASKVPLENDETMLVVGKVKEMKKLTKNELWNLYYDLCHPLRQELDVADDCMILPTLFQECKNEHMEITCDEEPQMSKLKPEVKPDVSGSDNAGTLSVADLLEC